MVRGGAVGESAIGIDEMVVEGVVPVVVDILGVGEVDLVGLVEGAVVGEHLVGCLGLVEGDVLRGLVVAGKEGGLVCKSGGSAERREDGVVGMAQLGDCQEVVAIKRIEAVVELAACEFQRGVFDGHDFHLTGLAVEHEDRVLQYTVGCVFMKNDAKDRTFNRGGVG